MRRVVLITGGSRSGKSAYALRRGETLPGPRAFIATCPVVDDEMQRRIETHKAHRDATLWDTIEEPTDLVGVVERSADYVTLLIDCLTLWINNLTYPDNPHMEEETIAEHARAVVAACQEQQGTLLLVTNELGMGIVPGDVATRRFRDFSGRCNQTFGQCADEIVLLVSGHPLHVKG